MFYSFSSLMRFISYAIIQIGGAIISAASIVSMLKSKSSVKLRVEIVFVNGSVDAFLLHVGDCPFAIPVTLQTDRPI